MRLPSAPKDRTAAEDSDSPAVAWKGEPGEAMILARSANAEADEVFGDGDEITTGEPGVER